MFSGNLKGLRKSVWFRLTAWYSGIFIASALLLFGIAYFLLSSSLNKQDRETIELRIKELSKAYQAGGIKSLEREVTVERKFQKKVFFFVRLAGKTNRTAFLSIPYQWTEFDLKKLEDPNFISAEEDMTWVWVPSKGGRNELRVASVHMGDDSLLQVGMSTDYREKVLRHFREIFAAVMIPLILFSLTGGTFLAFRALKPIRDLINTIRSIRSGRMDARVPGPQTGDEMEELITLFNEMVERIATLIKGMKNSLDNVAHDLRTPMTRLRGIAEMALQSDQNPDVYRDALADCLEESERILTMLNTLMDISEAETGVIRLDREILKVSDVLEDVVALYRYVAEEKHIAIHTTCRDGLLLNADRDRIRQVLSNLLDNAIKYTPEGGRIDMEAYRAGKEIFISVRDTGVGIPTEELPKIWDRLYRGDRSRSQRGLGLGLSLVRAIVNAHDGRVDVTSHPGKGSCFSIILPEAL
jgi:heavy metal sensor kinase